MKKVFLSLCVVMLAVFVPAHSYARKDIASHDLQLVKHEHLYTPAASSIENLYFDVCLLEEDNDDGSASEKKKYSSEKEWYTIISAIPTNFSDHLSRQVSFTNYFLSFSQPGFIYLRALRL